MGHREIDIVLLPDLNSSTHLPLLQKSLNPVKEHRLYDQYLLRRNPPFLALLLYHLPTLGSCL